MKKPYTVTTTKYKTIPNQLISDLNCIEIWLYDIDDNFIDVVSITDGWYFTGSGKLKIDIGGILSIHGYTGELKVQFKLLKYVL